MSRSRSAETAWVDRRGAIAIGALHGAHDPSRPGSDSAARSGWDSASNPIARVEAAGSHANPYISHVTLTTRSGRVVLDNGGHSRGECYVYDVPEGREFVGFTGRSGSKIDALGIVYRFVPPTPPPIRC